MYDIPCKQVSYMTLKSLYLKEVYSLFKYSSNLLAQRTPTVDCSNIKSQPRKSKNYLALVKPKSRPQPHFYP